MESPLISKYTCFYNYVFVIPNDLKNSENEYDNISNDFDNISLSFNSLNTSNYSINEHFKFLSVLKDNWKNDVKKSINISKFNFLKKFFINK